MTCCVLDCSAALAWVLPGEGTEANDRLLRDIVADEAVAPALWMIEMAATLVAAERRTRIAPAERQAALQFLSALPIVLEPPRRERVWTEAIALGLGHGLSVYDALYLEAALRLRLPLATLDKALIRAAQACGVVVAGA